MSAVVVPSIALHDLLYHREPLKHSLSTNPTAYITISKDDGNNLTWFGYGKAELSRKEYSVPYFNKINPPRLATTIRVYDKIEDKSFNISVELKWECTANKKRITHRPNPNDPDDPLIAYIYTSCSAVAKGSIVNVDDAQSWITTTESSDRGEIGHMRLLLMEPEQ